MRAASASLWARSIPRVGSSSRTAAQRLAAPAPPRARAAGARRRTGRAGWPRSRPSSPAAATPPRAGVLDRVLVDQVVARVLEQQRDLAGALDAPARGLGQPLGQPQQRALAGAVAAHQRDPLAGPQLEVEPAQHARAVLDLEPDAAQRERRLGAVVAAQQPARRAGRRGAGAARRLDAHAAQQPGARLLDRRRALRQAGEREQARRRGGQHRHRVGGPGEVLARRARRRRSGPPPARSRGRPRAGSAPGGARPRTTAVPQSSLSRRSSQTSSSPATGSSCEVGSSSSSSSGPCTIAAAIATRCSSPPESVSVRRSSRWPMPSDERRLLHRARDRGRRLAAVLERQLQLGAHAAHHHLRLGLLEDGAAHGGQLARAVLAHVEPADHQRARSPRRRGSAGRARRARAAASTCPSPTRRRAP